VTWPQWQALAAACERHGVPALFRSDHYLPLDGHHERPVLDAWATICGLAATTSVLRLGTLVSPATFRRAGVRPRSAALAARFADEYNTPFATPEDVRERRATVARAWEQAGRDPAAAVQSP
jgi:alkanesulfonate monooxygenase SsuD/methylene tetrahydromethanopterin reductase-like flavin-dependent oxidoreductase (luciferase family)